MCSSAVGSSFGLGGAVKNIWGEGYAPPEVWKSKASEMLFPASWDHFGPKCSLPFCPLSHMLGKRWHLYFNLVQSKLYINVLNLSTAGMFLYALVDSVLN